MGIKSQWLTFLLCFFPRYCCTKCNEAAFCRLCERTITTHRWSPKCRQFFCWFISISDPDVSVWFLVLVYGFASLTWTGPEQKMVDLVSSSYWSPQLNTFLLCIDTNSPRVLSPWALCSNQKLQHCFHQQQWRHLTWCEQWSQHINLQETNSQRKSL